MFPRLVFFALGLILLASTGARPALGAISHHNTWVRTYGGSGIEQGYSMQQTSDNGFIVAGFTDNSGMGDVQVLRLNSTGAVMWARTYGNPTAFDAAFSLQTMPDGGFVVAGITNGYAVNGLIAGDFWVFKIDATGDIVWQHAYGGSGADYAISMAKTSDNGLIVAGWTNSFGAGGNDAWLLRLDNSGGVIWQKAYGGTGDDMASTVEQTSDGGFIVAGSTNSSGAGGQDAWLFKLNPKGNIVWQKTYGGPADDHAISAQQTTDGGFVVAATTSSFGNGNSDIWILKLKQDGSISKACDNSRIMEDSNATVTNTDATVTTTTAVPNDTTVVATATRAITMATSEASQAKCSSSRRQDGQSRPPEGSSDS